MQSERSDSENGKVEGGRRGRGWASSKNLRRTSSIAAVAFAPHLLLSACLPVDDKWERERPLSFPYMKHETVYERARVHEGVVHVARVNFGPRVIALRPPTSFHAPSFRPPFLIPFSPPSLFSSHFFQSFSLLVALFLPRHATSNCSSKWSIITREMFPHPSFYYLWTILHSDFIQRSHFHFSFSI